MAASLLTRDDVILQRVPDITDVHVMIDLLRSLGASISYDGESRMTVNCARVSSVRAPYELVKRIHASFDVTGPLLARFKEAEVPLPGGCVLGYRGVDFHISGFQALGATVSLEHGYIHARATSLTGIRFLIERSSVGATKNLMMAACLAEGTTVLENAAMEPEVADLANFLNSMGAKISGQGTSIITVEGVQALHGGEYTIISDRIEAGTYLLAGALTKGKVKVAGISPFFLESFLKKLEEAGVKVTRGRESIEVEGSREILPVDVMTGPFPGFATDLQAPIVSLLATAKGTSTVQETIFDGRFSYVPELRRMGADIKVADRTAVVRGVEVLTGAPVEAPDIRAGGALVLAGLCAQGETCVGGVEYIERGYEGLERKFSSLGASIKKVCN